jgi:hypothetical protein
MIKGSNFLALMLLAVLSYAVTAQMASGQTLAVQESKSDSSFLSDIPHVVQEWTLQCSRKETTDDPTTGQCWRNAAFALTRFTEGVSEALVKQVESLQAAWLDRAAQLETPRTSGKAEPVGAEKAPAAPDTLTPQRVKKVQPIRMAPNLDAQSPRLAAVPLMKPKVKLASTAKAIGIKQKQKSAPKAIKKRKVKITATAEQLTSSRHVRESGSETKALRSSPQGKKRKIGCSTLKCIIEKWRE